MFISEPFFMSLLTPVSMLNNLYFWASRLHTIYNSLTLTFAFVPKI